jgi:sortase A
MPGGEMQNPTERRSPLGTILITVAIVLLLVGGGSIAWSAYQGASLRSRLAAAQPVVPFPTRNRKAAVHAPQATETPIPPPGPPVRIVIPDLKIDVAVGEMSWVEVYSGGKTTSEWVVPPNMAGHAINSAPLGVPGNIVLSGHNNIYSRVFMAISQAWPEAKKQQVDAATYRADILNGHEVDLFSADGRKFVYRITDFYRLHDAGVSLNQQQANARYMQPTSDPVLTLITCWPPDSNTYRLVVRAILAQ